MKEHKDERRYTKLETYFGNGEFGFRNRMEFSRDSLFALQILLQRCRDVNADIHVCFIDFNGGFDTVRHYKLINTQGTTG